MAKRHISTLLLFLLSHWGVPHGAEIIPIEPEPAHTGVGSAKDDFAA